MFCVHCGKQIDDDSRVCTYCGTPVAGAAPFTPQAEPAPAQAQPAEPAPVQAQPVYTQPVYAQPAYGAPVQAPAKKKSKLPLILSLAGGLVVILVVVGILVFGSLSKSGDYEKAETYLLTGAYEEALEIYQDLEDYEDSQRNALFCQASLSFEDGNYKKTIEYLDQLPAYPRAEDLWNQIEKKYGEGQRMLRQEDYESAAAFYAQFGDYEDAEDYVSYCNAMAYCAVGDYESAFYELEDVDDLEEARILLMQIYYETRLFEGLSDLRSYLKAPDTLSLLSVEAHFYPVDKAGDSGVLVENPAIIIRESAQNGLGGYSTSYVLFNLDKETGVYEYLGSCDSLDISDYDKDDEDELLEAIVALAIGLHMDNPEIENAINLERVNDIVSMDKYTRIKQLPELTFSMIADTVFANTTESTDSNSGDV